MSKRTNTELVKDIMTFSKHGALSQIFVIAALQNYTDRIIQNKKDIEVGGFINKDSWIGVAEEIKEKIEEHLNS